MTPENKLWAAVINTAVIDMFRGGSESESARDFLLGNSRWLNQVCDMAAMDKQWLQDKIAAGYTKLPMRGRKRKCTNSSPQ